MTLTDELADVLSAAALADEVKERMQGCLPTLAVALADAGHATAAFIVAAATPTSSLVLASDYWAPVPPGTPTDRAQAALALYKAVESPGEDSGEIVFRSLALTLGVTGITMLHQDYKHYVELKQQPLIVVLAELNEGLVSLVCTVQEMPRPTVH